MNMRGIKRFGWDLLQLHRNNLVVLAFVVAGMYLGIFKLLEPLGTLRSMLVLLVFNDPVVTGLLFGGVIMLFEKSQNTLAAVQVSPLSLEKFLASKVLALTFLATVSALLMNLAAIGIHFNWLHFILGTALISAFFILAGFYFGQQSQHFTQFLVKSIGFILISALPFLGYYEVVPEIYFYWLPPFAGIKLIEAAYFPVAWPYILYGYGYLILSILLFWRTLINKLQNASL